MGLLSDLGEILSPEDSAALQPHLRQLGIRQFLNIFKKYKSWQKKESESIVKWGEEIQGHFLILNQKGELQLCLEPLSAEYDGIDFPLMLEYGRWMFEMVPSQPYCTKCDLREIVISVRNKYAVLHSKSRIALTIPTVPFLGLRDPNSQKKFINEITQSQYISDNHIADHIRFRTLTNNIRKRRRRTVEMNVPVFMDRETKLEELALTEPNPSYVYMDAMAFGMGMSCLQCTFSTQNLDHARYVYDQMHVLSPLMLAMTAATPFHKGKLVDWDARWHIIEGSVDCRNEQQRNPQSEHYLPTSRYSQASLYIWNGEYNRPEYNDATTNISQSTVQYIKDMAKQIDVDIDKKLIMHLANIFKRDVLIVHEKFKTMSDDDNVIFEMLNGTNWNSVRLKIPTDDQIGWRVEFRTMEVQLTADQNSAFSLLINFFTRSLHNNKDLNLYMPISYVKKNFDIAHKRDAMRKEKFYMRVNVFDANQPIIKQLTLHEIFFGTPEYPNYPGIFNHIKKILSQDIECEPFIKVVEDIGTYLRDLTLGKRISLAQWMREYIDKHPLYKHNSILPKKVMDNLLLTLNQIAKGSHKDANFSPIFSF